MKRTIKTVSLILAGCMLALSGLACLTVSAAEKLPENMVYVDPALTATGDYTFTFSGKEFTGTVGTNVFKTLKEGLAALTPGGTMLLAPATYTEGLVIDKNVSILGPKYDVDPNSKGMNVTDDWIRNPDRGTGEAVIATSWHMGVNAGDKKVYDCTEITIDGVAVTGTGMFRSNYGGEGSITLNYRNILIYGYTTGNNGPFYCYSYYPDRSTNKYVRTVNFENIRFEGQTTAPGFNLTVDKLNMKGIYFDAASTGRLFAYVTTSSATASTAPVEITVTDSMFRQKAGQVVMLDLATGAGGHGFNSTISKKTSVTATVKNCVFYENDLDMSEDNMITCNSNTSNVSFVRENNSFISAGTTEKVVDEHTYDLDKEVRFFGRTWNDGVRYYFNWSASGFTFSFTGSGATATIHSNAPGGDNGAWIKIYVDGVWKKDVVLASTEQDVVLAKNLDPNVMHTVKVVKRTNARSSTAAVSKITIADGKKEAPEAAKTRLIEFVGDSLTVGYGSIADKATAWSTATEDVMKTYIPAIADAFDAEYNVIAVSGRGVVKNYGGDTDKLMGEIYPQTDIYNKTGAKWDFEGNQPDVIVINLGENDGTMGVSTSDMKAGCIALIKQIRALNPNAEIIWTFGLTGSTEAHAIKSAVEQVVAEGDTHVTYFKLSPCKESEKALGHPLAAGYAARAQSVIDVVAAATGWTAKPTEAETSGAVTETTEVPGTGSDVVTETVDPAPAKKGCGASTAAVATMTAAATAAAVSVKKKKED